MSELNILYNRMLQSMAVPGLHIPLTAVQFYRGNTTIPEAIKQYEPDSLTITSCQAAKQSSLGDPILLTKKTIGCVAAAITFGLVDQYDPEPMVGSRIYTDIMKDHAKNKKTFTPPAPLDFTQGTVYACKSSEHKDFALFGEDDSGRFHDQETAARAVSEMAAIQPPDTSGVFFFSEDFPLDIRPDIIVLSVRPVELTRLIQAFQFYSGERVHADMGGLRAVNSDLIVRPYLSQKINISPYCLGARLIAKYSADRLGIGMPYPIFAQLVQGIEDSSTGYPFSSYPGAADLSS